MFNQMFNQMNEDLEHLQKKVAINVHLPERS